MDQGLVQIENKSFLTAISFLLLPHDYMIYLTVLLNYLSSAKHIRKLRLISTYCGISGFEAPHCTCVTSDDNAVLEEDEESTPLFEWRPEFAYERELELGGW